jgi:uncharacterized membrane protein
MATSENDKAHWKKTTNLMLGASRDLVFLRLRHPHVRRTAEQVVIPMLGFPLGFYMAAQGSLIVFVVMLFVFAKQQDRSTASSASLKTIEGETPWLPQTQRGTIDFHQKSRPHVRHLYRRLRRLHRPARDPRAGRRPEQDSRLPVRVLHARRSTPSSAC